MEQSQNSAVEWPNWLSLLNHLIDKTFRPIYWVIFRSIQLYVRVQDNYSCCNIQLSLLRL